MKKLLTLVGLPLLLALLALPVSSHYSQMANLKIRSDPQTLPTNQIIVQFSGETTKTQLLLSNAEGVLPILSATAGVPLTYGRPMALESHVLSLPGKMPLDQIEIITARLLGIDGVIHAEPDRILQVSSESFAPAASPELIPDDPLWDQMWHLHYAPDTDEGINALAAWDIFTGSSETVIAVIDTGILAHDDLAGRILPGYDFISHPLVANDGDGRDPDPSDPGDWITSAESSEPGGFFEGCFVTNSSWHGLHVAGTIAANTDNGLGIAGVNWQANILPVRVLGKCGGFTSDIIDGMLWSAGLPVTDVPDNENPAKVLNLSLGGFGACSTAQQSAIDAIVATGSIIVVAAGNANLNVNNFNPANCDGVIAVAATNRAGNKAFYSNFGSLIGISAPGGDGGNRILSTLDTGAMGPDHSHTYAAYVGTSMAAPHVSGVVSLLVGMRPDITPAEALALLQSTARPFPAGSTCNTGNCGAGIVDAHNALTALFAHVLFVNHATPPGGDGSSWGSAFNDLQEALAAAEPGNEIWVAAGIYKPTDDPTDRETSFHLQDGVAIYGGFAGWEIIRDERDWESNLTVLSGDIDNNDITDPAGVVTDTANIVGDNSYHVVVGSGVTVTAVLDGFVITAGLANGGSFHNLGGGLQILAASPTLDKLLFSGNRANEGGGIGSHNSSPTLTNIIFRGNSASFGGGMRNFASDSRLTNITFTVNTANMHGGGMYNNNSPVVLTNVTFHDNSAGSGGGIHNWNSEPALMNVSFRGNTAAFGGGMTNDGSNPNLSNTYFSGNLANLGSGIYNFNSSPAVTNATFSSNLAYVYGGGIHNNGGSNPTIQNSIFWNNEDNSGVGTAASSIANISSNPIIRYSLVQGCNPDSGWEDACGENGGNNPADADPLFVEMPDPADAPTTTGNLRLQAGSPAIDAGNNDYVIGVPTDLDGNPRIIGAAVDLGPYESDAYLLTVNVVGAGAVVLEPDVAAYAFGQVVTVTAVAGPGWTFWHWSGDLSGSTNPTTILMDGNKTITATLAGIPNMQVSLAVSHESAQPGETITYTLTITNSGVVDLSDLIAAVTVPGSFDLPENLAPGMVVSTSYSYTVVAADLPGPLINEVMVTAVPPTGDPLTTTVAVTTVIESFYLYLPLVFNQ